MELKRDEIIKALECISTDEILCSPNCPYFANHCEVALSRDALALIKQLTEENERLRAPRFIAYPDGTTELIPSVESVRSDTVRKMQEQIKAEIEHFDKRGGYAFLSKYVVFLFIDKIAKEMQEQEVDNGRETAKC